MAGNTSKIKIISNALIAIGDAPISSLDDAGAGAIVAKNFYPSSYRNALSMHRWRFAAKKMQLSRLAEAPLADFKYQYQLPSDYIQLHRCDGGNDYEIYEDKIYTDYETLVIDYTYEVSEDFLPAYFVKALEWFLAAEFAIPITGNTARAKEYIGLYLKQMSIAKSQDSMARPSRPIQDDPFGSMFR